MKRYLSIFRMDASLMGVNFYFPWIILSLYAIGMGLYCRFGVMSYEPIAKVGEAALPFLGAWWSVFLLGMTFEEKGGEVLFTYPVSTFMIGVIRVVMYGVLYFAVLGMAFLMLRIMTGLLLVELLAQYIVQSFFFAALGFFCIVMTRNSGISLLILLAYDIAFHIGYEILPLSLNVFLLNPCPVPFHDLAVEILPKVIRMSAAFLILAHLRLDRLRAGA